MTKPYYLIFTFLCVLFSIKPALAENADSLYQIGQFRPASLEYERIIAFSNNQFEINEARYKKTLCYKQLNQYNKAQIELLKISYWNIQDSLVIKYRYETTLCSYLSGNFNEALLQMGMLESYSASLSRSNKATLLALKALSLNELMQWNNAYTAACAYIDYVYPRQTADSTKLVLKKLYSKKNLPKIRSEKKANVLKMMPGLGQAYAGNPIEGMVNFTINLAFLSFGVYEIFQGYYITGYFVGAIGLNKVYFGGHARTTFLIHKNNYKKQRNFCDKIRKALIIKKPV